MQSKTTGLALAKYDLRRAVQTRRVFVNWPTLLRQMVSEKFGHEARDLEFVTRTGLRLHCPNLPGARLPLYEQHAEDCYRVRDFLGPLRDQPMHVLDIGAQIGAFATFVARLFPQSTVDCFEPSAQTARYLSRNIEQNNLAAQIDVHVVAIADHNGTALLDDNDGASVHNGLIQDGHRLVEGTDSADRRHRVEVRTITFDAAVAASRRPPSVVKLDCEGAEYALVYASTQGSWASVTRVIVEHHQVHGQSWDELRQWFAGTGFKVVDHESRSPGLGIAWLARGSDG